MSASIGQVVNLVIEGAIRGTGVMVGYEPVTTRAGLITVLVGGVNEVWPSIRVQLATVETRRAA